MDSWDDFHDAASPPYETPPTEASHSGYGIDGASSSCDSSHDEILTSESVSLPIAPLRYAITSTGNWSRDEFARRILLHLTTSGEDTALAHLMDTFPRLTFENAKLWLFYLKDVSSRGIPFDPYIMDTFRQTDWYTILREGAAQDVVNNASRFPDTVLDNIASGSTVRPKTAPYDQERHRNIDTPGGSGKARALQDVLDAILSRRDQFDHLDVNIILGDIHAGAVTFS
ncbi:hypothetical protein EXIGLDRAFT_833568 [Exidia glandulosa HHB12029]|uniref:Uncharacterized protein n=1 Tax=Exidia glandulosa HHB12029 TaxID=1314781 RepID=A0A165KKA6_EXIGL|nr:hypothetical protein EXIGLDRAFT_833568 [Exidia glandulosa HHB12029]